ncbi:MAG: hypothetical protein J6I73_05875 [Treponema sp.]|nr:hypothetical protein [Treponema sp.]
MREKTVDNIALAINAVSFIMGIWAILNNIFCWVEAERIWATDEYGSFVILHYFTNDSNILLLFAEFLIIVLLIRKIVLKIPLPEWVITFKCIATCSVAIVFFIIAFGFVLLNKNFTMWAVPNMLFTHLLCPLCAIVSFIFFEPFLEIRKRVLFYSAIPLIVYMLVITPLASLGFIGNIYGIMDVFSQPWWVNIMLTVGLIAVTAFCEFVIILMRKKLR